MLSEQKCRFCSCTNDRACPGGCHWVKPGYCSACRELHLGQLVDRALNFSPRPGAMLAGKPRRIETEGPFLTVFDHIGTVAFTVSALEAYLAPQYDAHEVMALFHGEEDVAA